MDINEVKSDFQLLATSIKKIDFQNNFVYFNNENEDLVRNMDASYEIENIRRDDADDTIMGTISLNVVITLSDNESEMICDLIIQGCFYISDNQDIDQFKNMLQVNGCATLYSIARGIILNITSQACFGAHILLPMINLFRLKETKEGSPSEAKKE